MESKPKEGVRTFAVFPSMDAEKGSIRAIEKSLLAHFILLSQAQVMVELGVFKAQTTEFICNFVTANNLPTKVYGFDLEPVVSELRATDKAVQHYEREQRLKLIPGRLPYSLRQWLAETNDPIDLALVDATHDYESVTQELILLWPRLRRGGYILCHDYSVKWEGVRYAVDRFAASHRAHMLPLLSPSNIQETDVSSVLVGLAKPYYDFNYARWGSFEAQRLLNPARRRFASSALWRNVLRPLVRRK